MRGPGTAQDDVVFTVEEVGGVAWIGGHRLKAIPFLQRGTSPLPDATEVALSTESRPVLRDGCRSPIFESHVAAF